MITQRFGSDSGLSLVEVLIAMGITAISGVLLLTIAFTADDIDRFTRDDSAALDELRIATERITKEIRQARLVYDDSTDRMIHVWIDYDVDNQQDADERVYWEVRTAAGDTDLVRYTDADPTAILVVSEGVVDAATFAYDPAIGSIPRVVTITLTFDQDDGEGPGTRVIESEIRLRNAATP